MQYRRLGNAGVKVSQVALGSWLTFGRGVDDDTARLCIRRAFELGINFFDTADIYTKGAAEEVLGRELKPLRRQDLFVATKLFWPMSENVNDRGLSRKHVFESIANSLRRLQMDYVDLYQCHRFDGDTPLEETVRAMDDLVRAGKILYWGVSEWPAEEIENACRIAREMNACQPVSEQPEYSIAARRVETNGVQRACGQNGVGMIVWSPLKQGLLTGKYSGGNVPAGSRAADEKMNKFLSEIMEKQGREITANVDQLKPIAEKLGITLAQLAIAWLLKRDAVSSVIVGASRVAQVEENAAAVDVSLPDQTAREIDTLFPAEQFQ